MQGRVREVDPRGLGQGRSGYTGDLLGPDRNRPRPSLPPRHDLRRVDVPVLVSRGDQTPRYFPPVAEAIVEAMPSAEGRVLNGLGHAPHLTHPEKFVTTVADFLTR